MLHIDRVRLRGINPGDEERVVAELRETLIAQLGEPGAGQRLAGIGHLESLRAVAGPPPAASRPQSLGQSAGQAVARTLTQT